MHSFWAACVALWILSIQSVRAVDNTSDTFVLLDNKTNLCGRDETFTYGQYSFSTNLLEPQAANGWQCMEVGEAQWRFNNETAWAVSWTWDGSSATTLHSFPHARLNHTILPTQISNLNTLWLYSIWTYAAGNDSSQKMDVSDVASAEPVTNVVLDVFIDSDRQKAGSPTEAKYEMMIWLASYGGLRPIGYKDSPVMTRTVSKVKFNLYEGKNDRGQQVYSWVAEKNTTSFFSDLSSLLHTLVSGHRFSNNDYVGLVRFGTQTYRTKPNSPVTFAAQVMKLEVIPGTPKPLDSGVGRLRVGSSSLLLSVGVCLAAIFFG